MPERPSRRAGLVRMARVFAALPSVLRSKTPFFEMSYRSAKNEDMPARRWSRSVRPISPTTCADSSGSGRNARPHDPERRRTGQIGSHRTPEITQSWRIHAASGSPAPSAGQKRIIGADRFQQRLLCPRRQADSLAAPVKLGKGAVRQPRARRREQSPIQAFVQNR